MKYNVQENLHLISVIAQFTVMLASVIFHLCCTFCKCVGTEQEIMHVFGLGLCMI